MNGVQRLELISAIGRKLQEDMTFTDIKTYFSGHGIDYASKKTSDESSKWIFTKEVLADEPDNIIIKLGAELGLIEEQEPTATTHVATQSVKKNESSQDTTKKRIFISHAVKDKALADSFVDLLETGIGISSNEVFCSSLPGQGISAGERFVEFIKDRLIESDHVIFLMSPNFLESKFCQNELGGTWTLGKRYTPFVVSPARRNEIKDVLTGVQILRIEDDNDLDEFESEIKKVLNITGKETPKWNSKKAQFLEQAKAIIAELPAPNIVTFEQHQSALKDLEEYKEALNVANSKLDECKETVSALKNEEPGDARNKAYYESLPFKQSFEELAKKIKAKMKKFNPAVREAIFYSEKNEVFVPVVGYDWDYVQDGLDNKFIFCDENQVTINEDNLQIKKLQEDFQTLRDLVSNDESVSEFSDGFESDNEYSFELDNKQLWKDYFGF